MVPFPASLTSAQKASPANSRIGKVRSTMGGTMRKFLIGLVGCMALSTQAKAEPTANEYLRSGKPELLQILAGGLGLGLEWASTFVEVRGDEPIYCPPDHLAVTSHQYVEILRQHVKREPKSGDEPVGRAMLLALRGTFPCKQ